MAPSKSWLIVAIAALLALAFAALEDGLHPMVAVKNGTILGKWRASRAGEVFASFEGIPFAAPVTRFEPPRPSNWSGTLDARSAGSVCAQQAGNSQIGAEDCLYLNVYMPKSANASSDPLTVMVWIHGGAFVSGTGSMYSPTFLMDQGVVLVTINYRLGAFGFLNSGDGTVGGNLGLKDQIMALRWVQENIGFFNGDPGNVTIFGESAGGASVSLLQVSPAAKGLFQRVIAQSGSSLSPWAIQNDPVSVANNFATAAGCPWPTMKLKIQCLQSKSTKELLDAQKSLKDVAIVTFGPSIDASVIPDYPKFLITNTSATSSGLPTMIGRVADEGRMFTGFSPATLALVNLFWNTLAPKLFYYESYFKNDKKAMDRVSAGIRKLYFNNKFISDENKQNFTDATSDIGFLIGPKQNAWVQARNSRNVYSYFFTYKGNFTLIPPADMGPTHADELQYLFNFNEASVGFYIPGLYPNGDDEKFSLQMTKLWADFAKGNTDNLKMQAQDEEVWAPMPKETKDERSTMNYYVLDKTSKMASEEEAVLKRWAGLKEVFKGTPLEFLV